MSSAGVEDAIPGFELEVVFSVVSAGFSVLESPVFEGVDGSVGSLLVVEEVVDAAEAVEVVVEEIAGVVEVVVPAFVTTGAEVDVAVDDDVVVVVAVAPVVEVVAGLGEVESALEAGVAAAEGGAGGGISCSHLT